MTIVNDTNGNATDVAGNGGRPVRDIRVAIIGSGFSGLGMAIRLRQQGIEDFLVFERGDDVGGTWRDNTYPGASCDVFTLLYCYSFAPNPHWEKTFASQPEILEYLRNCADRFGVRPHLRTQHELLGARWDEIEQRWHLETSQGDYRAEILVMGTGYLSEPSIPSLKGLESFQGTTFHSSRWNHDHDLSGRRVAVIGTGASAIQFVPKIQPIVGHMDLYQRTPPWIGPHKDKPNKGLTGWLLRTSSPYRRFRRNRNRVLREILVFTMRRPKVMGKLQNMPSGHLKKSVPDPELRARLTPDYLMGCKRMLFSDTWYPAIQQHNVEIVSDGIAEVRPSSIVTTDGREREIDTIIFGTGFLPTSRPVTQRVWGRGGLKLADAWKEWMSGYRGTAVSGFPNMFMLMGPNTTSAHTSMTLMIEAQIAYVLDAVRQMEKAGVGTVDVRPEVQAAYNERLQEQLQGTVWTAGGCNSWYLDANGRNSTLWPGYTRRFRKMLQRFDLDAYETTAPVAPGRPVRVTAREETR